MATNGTIIEEPLGTIIDLKDPVSFLLHRGKGWSVHETIIEDDVTTRITQVCIELGLRPEGVTSALSWVPEKATLTEVFETDDSIIVEFEDQP